MCMQRGICVVPNMDVKVENESEGGEGSKRKRYTREDDVLLIREIVRTGASIAPYGEAMKRYMEVASTFNSSEVSSRKDMTWKKVLDRYKVLMHKYRKDCLEGRPKSSRGSGEEDHQSSELHRAMHELRAMESAKDKADSLLLKKEAGESGTGKRQQEENKGLGLDGGVVHPQPPAKRRKGHLASASVGGVPGGRGAGEEGSMDPSQGGRGGVIAGEVSASDLHLCAKLLEEYMKWKLENSRAKRRREDERKEVESCRFLEKMELKKARLSLDEKIFEEKRERQLRREKLEQQRYDMERERMEVFEKQLQAFCKALSKVAEKLDK